MNPLSFPSPVKQSVEVTIGEAKYKLYEPSGAISDDYRRALAECTKVNDGKVEVVNPGAAIGAGKMLLSACLKDDKDKAVPVESIQDWPSSISDALVAAVLDFLPKNTPEEGSGLKNS